MYEHLLLLSIEIIKNKVLHFIYKSILMIIKSFILVLEIAFKFKYNNLNK